MKPTILIRCTHAALASALLLCLTFDTTGATATTISNQTNIIYTAFGGGSTGGTYTNPVGTVGIALRVATNAFHATPTNPVCIFIGANLPSECGPLTNYGANVHLQGMGDLSIITFTNGGFVQAGTNSTLSSLHIHLGPYDTNSAYTETGWLATTLHNVTLSAPAGTALGTFYGDAQSCYFGGLTGIANLWGGVIEGSTIVGTNYGVASMTEYPVENFASDPFDCTNSCSFNHGFYRLPSINGSHIRGTAATSVGVIAAAGSDPHSLNGTDIQMPTYTIDPATNHFSVGIEGGVTMNGGWIQANVPGRNLRNANLMGLTFAQVGNGLTNFSVIDGCSGMFIVGSYLSGNAFANVITNYYVPHAGAGNVSAIVGSIVSGAIDAHRDIPNGLYYNCTYDHLARNAFSILNPPSAGTVTFQGTPPMIGTNALVASLFANPELNGVYTNYLTMPAGDIPFGVTVMYRQRLYSHYLYNYSSSTNMWVIHNNRFVPKQFIYAVSTNGLGGPWIDPIGKSSITGRVTMLTNVDPVTTFAGVTDTQFGQDTGPVAIVGSTITFNGTVVNIPNTALQNPYTYSNKSNLWWVILSYSNNASVSPTTNHIYFNAGTISGGTGSL